MFDFRPVPCDTEGRTMAHLHDEDDVILGFVSFVATTDGLGPYSRVAAEALSNGRSARYTAVLQAPGRRPHFTDDQIIPEVMPVMNNPLAEQLTASLRSSGVKVAMRKGGDQKVAEHKGAFKEVV